MCASQHRPVFRAPTATDVQISANEAFIVDMDIVKPRNIAMQL
jgi:hypothetical protein